MFKYFIFPINELSFVTSWKSVYCIFIFIGGTVVNRVKLEK